MIVFSIFFIILCIGSVWASEDNTQLSIDDENIALENEHVEPIAQEKDISSDEILKEVNSTDTTTTDSETASKTNTDTQTKQETKKLKHIYLPPANS